MIIWIAWRYLKSKQRRGFVSLIAQVSAIGIAIGVAVLIAVLAVFNGFAEEVRSRILETVAHAIISDPSGKLENWQDIAQVAGRSPEVLATAPFINGGAMLMHDHRAAGVLVRGIIPRYESQVDDIEHTLLSGSLKDLNAEGGILLGQAVAQKLAVEPGDRVILVTVTKQADQLAALRSPKLQSFKVVGIFSLGMQQYDAGLVLLNLRDAARAFNYQERVSGLRIKVAHPELARSVASAIVMSLPPPRLVITDWTVQNENFFIALAQQREMIFLVLALIVAIAAFNIVSTLVIAVADKASAIAILRTLGLTPSQVMVIFIMQGTMIGLVGTLLGMVGGVLLALNLPALATHIESYFGFRFLDPDIYPLSHLPSDLRGADVALVGFLAFVLSVLSTLYPARKAALVIPAEALRA